MRARRRFLDLCYRNLTFKIKFSFKIFCRFFKIISQFAIKSQIFSLAAPENLKFFVKFPAAAPSNRTGAAPTQLQTAAPPRPTPATRGRGTRTFVRRMSDVRQSECPTSYVRQTYVRQRVSQT